MCRISPRKIPQDDGMMIRFALNNCSIWYHTDDFKEFFSDNRINLIEIQNFINEIIKVAAPIVLRKILVYNFVSMVLLLIIGGILLHNNISIGAWFIIVPLYVFFILNAIIILYITCKRKDRYNTANNMIKINQARFQNFGLRWVISSNLLSLELWVDGKYNNQNYNAPSYAPNYPIQVENELINY